MTEGVQVEADATFAARLEGLLRESGQRTEVLNLGLSSIGTAQQLLLLQERGLAFGPDVVLLAFCTLNDFHNNSEALNHDPERAYPLVDDNGHLTRSDDGHVMFTSPTRPSRLKRFLQTKSTAYRWLRHTLPKSELARQLGLINEPSPALERMNSIYNPARTPQWEAAATTTWELLGELNEVVLRHGARLVVAVIPAPWEVSSQWRTSIGFDDSWDLSLPERELLDVLASLHVPAVELSPTLRETVQHGNEVFFVSDGHLNERGHALVASELATVLEAELRASDRETQE